MSRRLTDRLVAHATARADAVTAYTDAIGHAVNRVVQRAWQDLLRSLKPGIMQQAANYQRARAILDALPVKVWRELRRSLGELIEWTHDDAAEALVKTLPLAALQAAAAKRLRESRDELSAMRLPRRAFWMLGVERPLAVDLQVPLLEAGALAFGLFDPDQGIDALDTAAPLRPDSGETLTEAEQRRLFAALLFPAPDQHQVAGILDRLLPPADWLGPTPGAPTPGDLDRLIADGTAQGLSMRTIAQRIRPHFEGSAVRATRAARTLGAYVGTERNFATSEALGDMIVGYEVRDPGGPTARPDHMRRSGTRYYREPKPGQLSMEVCPHPPYDRGGPNEDGTGLKWNCRCFLVPLLRGMEAFQGKAAGPQGTLASGQEVQFTRHEGGGRQVAMVMVDPQKLDAAWRASNPDEYIPPGGGGAEIGGRREDFAQFLRKGKTIQSPRVYVGPDGEVSFEDGRHRFSLLRDLGVNRVAITVPRDQAAKVRKEMG